jgi:peptidoglycan/xylan/chitin deacetylase (PgdA/CDA1 family)
MIRSFFYCWLTLTLGLAVFLSEAVSWGQVFIVKYHDIPNPDVMTSYMDVAPDNFKDHIEFIDRQGFNVVSLAAIAEWIESGTSLPPKAIGICFDDNYIGNYENAFPILAAHRFHGTFSFIPDTSGS